VLTFLLTDIEGSTQLWDTSPDRMASALERHDRLVEKVVSQGGGMLLQFKGEGDSTLSVFQRASDAASAAVALNHTLAAEQWPGGLSLGVRMGLHTGEVYERDGDYWGPTLNRAARIRGLATAGQVLASGAVAELVQDRLPPDAVLVDLGAHQLKGLTRRERVFLLADTDGVDDGVLETQGLGVEIVRQGPSPTRDVLALPHQLALGPELGFIGREVERRRLSETLGEAVAGRQRRLVLVSGEAGVGKTSLVARLAGEARADGAIVLYGRCDEELGVPYQPFMEALRSYLAGTPSAQLSQMVSPYGGDLARLIPQLSERVPGLPEPLRAEPETERYRMFEAATRFLMTVSATTPLVLVLEDLHWAAKPTLLLLRHLIRAEWDGPMLLIATYRDTEVGRKHPLTEVLADLRRDPDIERVSLGGLDQGEVAEFLAAAEPAFDSNSAEAAQRIHAQTEGNPFFLGQLVHHLSESGAWDRQGGRGVMEVTGTPEGVREVIGRRLSHLEDQTNQVLSVAAVVGAEFDTKVLVAASGLDDESVLDGLEQSEDAGLTVSIPGRPRHGFVHALARAVIYDDIPQTRRMRMHRRVARALEQDGPDAHLGELAHHYAAAASLGEMDKAVDYARRAAVQAMDGAAYEEAAEHLARALDILEAQPTDRQESRAELLLELARALYSAGERTDARRRCEKVAALARELGRPDLLAEAALADWIGGVVSGRVDDQFIDLLEEALATLPPDDSRLRALAMARLAVLLYYVEAAADRRRFLAQAALDMARRLGDAETLTHALDGARNAVARPDNARERLAMAREMLDLAKQTRNRMAELAASYLLVIDLYELGDLVTARAVAARVTALAEELGARDWRWIMTVHSANVAIGEGRLEEGERLANQALDIGQRAENENALMQYGIQQFALCNLRGGLEDMEPLVKGTVAQYPLIPGWRSGLALLYRELGRVAEAREQFEVMAAHDFADTPFDANWMPAMAIASLVCSFVGDRERAAILYKRLLPYTESVVCVGEVADTLGSTHTFLAVLAATLERWREFESHAAEAVSRNSAMGLVSWTARTQYEVAALLAQRRWKGDAERARQLLEECLSTSERLGFEALGARAQRISGDIKEATR
jgi:class 3 adenylate cyclase/tetratricopeptide (TPR) repeat protein